MSAKYSLENLLGRVHYVVNWLSIVPMFLHFIILLNLETHFLGYNQKTKFPHIFTQLWGPRLVSELSNSLAKFCSLPVWGQPVELCRDMCHFCTKQFMGNIRIWNYNNQYIGFKTKSQPWPKKVQHTKIIRYCYIPPIIVGNWGQPEYRAQKRHA